MDIPLFFFISIFSIRFSFRYFHLFSVVTTEPCTSIYLWDFHMIQLLPHDSIQILLNSQYSFIYSYINSRLFPTYFIAVLLNGLNISLFKADILIVSETAIDMGITLFKYFHINLVLNKVYLQQLIIDGCI